MQPTQKAQERAMDSYVSIFTALRVLHVDLTLQSLIIASDLEHKITLYIGHTGQG
jgi:hypothetical protein